MALTLTPRSMSGLKLGKSSSARRVMAATFNPMAAAAAAP